MLAIAFGRFPVSALLGRCDFVGVVNPIRGFG